MPRFISLQFAQEQMPVVYDPGGVGGLQPQDFVVALRDNEEDVAFVAGIEFLSSEQLKIRPKPYPRIVRRASGEEKDAFFVRRAEERKALATCKEKTRELKLPIKITTARISAKDGRIVFHFTSDQRVDFRALVREMAMILSRRVELWQVGVRDEARMVDGFGVCGLRTCCSQWLTEFRPISIRMAQEQDIHMPPSKLSGQCGRLLCCLSYEVDQYKEMGRELKPKGATITVDGQQGVILDRNVLLGSYTVQLADGTVINVTEDQLANVRTPDQMKRMARVMRGEDPDPPETDASETRESPRGEGAAQDAGGEDDKAAARRSRRSRRSRRGKADRPEGSGAGQQPRDGTDREPQHDGGEQKGRRSGRKRRSRRTGSKSSDATPPRNDARPPGNAPGQGNDGNKGDGGGKSSSGRRRKRRKRGGGGSRGGGGGSPS